MGVVHPWTSSSGCPPDPTEPVPRIRHKVRKVDVVIGMYMDSPLMRRGTGTALQWRSTAVVTVHAGVIGTPPSEREPPQVLSMGARDGSAVRARRRRPRIVERHRIRSAHRTRFGCEHESQTTAGRSDPPGRPRGRPGEHTGGSLLPAHAVPLPRSAAGSTRRPRTVSTR